MISSSPVPPDAKASYDYLVDQVIEKMEAGIIPWRQPWYDSLPCNLHTLKSYRGVNVLYLTWQRETKGFESNYWCTPRQAELLGGYIKPLEILRSSTVILGKWIYQQGKNRKGQTYSKAYLMMRAFSVYNYDQTEGLERHLPKPHIMEFRPVARAESIIQGYPNAPQYRHNSEAAYYNAFMDSISIPGKSHFSSEPSYYATLFHEIVHSTGHPERLKRFGLTMDTTDEIAEYAREELVAEFGSLMLCAQTGILNESLSQSAAYLDHWLAEMRCDRKVLFWAAASAQKSCDWILDQTIKYK